MASILPFSLHWYLSQNPDVAEAVSKGSIEAVEHFDMYGKTEGRSANPLFNPIKYLDSNPDVSAAVVLGATTAYDHFVTYGAGEGRSPFSLYDEAFYLLQNPDVGEATEAGATTAAQHLLMYGQGEARPFNAFLDLGKYLKANPDVAQAVEDGFVTALGHLIMYGVKELRDLGNGVYLRDFANDPIFNKAVAARNYEAALARVGEVAPFLPAFEKPAGWTIPADTPIPTDFVPTGGKPLVVSPVPHVPPVSPVTPPCPGDSGSTNTFILTTGKDQLAGTAADDTFSAPILIDAGTLTATLQDIDALDGGAGDDALDATVQDGATVIPSLASIENVNLRSTADGSGMDFTKSNGVEKVVVANSTATAAIAVAGKISNIAVNNQTAAVDVTGSTATSLNLSFNKFGTSTTASTISVNSGTAISATVALVDSNVNLDTLASLKELTVAATGTNRLASASNGGIETLTVSGTGSLTFDGDLTALKTLTSTAEGVITVTGLGTSLEAATTGAGNDTVSMTGALAATAVVGLGVGGDKLVLNTAPTAGVTLSGGEGRDTLETTQDVFDTIIAAFSSEQKAKITGFEVLSISTALTLGSTVDLAGIAGIGNFVAAAGVLARGHASVTNLGASAMVEIAGNHWTAATPRTTDVTFANIAVGQIITINGLTYTRGADGDGTAANIATFFQNKAADFLNKTHTSGTAVGAKVTFSSVATGSSARDITVSGNGSAALKRTTTQGVDQFGAGTLSLSMEADTVADIMTVKLNKDYTENNDSTSTITALSNSVIASGVETLHVESTGKASTKFLGNEATKADGVNNMLVLADNDLVTLTVTGDQAFTFKSASSMTKLATIDASALTAGTEINAPYAPSASEGLTMKGSETAANKLFGSAGADTIIGGALGDTITGGAGYDTFKYASVTDSTTDQKDIINDFAANTKANATASKGAGLKADWTGDVIDVTALLAIAVGTGDVTGISIFVANNTSDALVFLQATAAAPANLTGFALDSSSGNLYLDIDSNGIVDSVIQLTSLTAITEAAFVTGIA